MEEHSAIGERILGEGGRLRGDCAHRSSSPRAHGRQRLSRSASRTRDSDHLPHHRGGRRLQRYDVRSAVQRCHAKSCSTLPARASAGTQFDTTVVAAFEAILAGAGETYLSGVRPDFALEAQRQPALPPSGRKRRLGLVGLHRPLGAQDHRLEADYVRRLLEDMADVDLGRALRDKSRVAISALVIPCASRSSTSRSSCEDTKRIVEIGQADLDSSAPCKFVVMPDADGLAQRRVPPDHR